MKTVDFGSIKVTPQEKTARVGEVFRRVAPRYDAMNDLMSLGTHRLMKRAAIEWTALRHGNRALDLAGGTGDLALLLSDVVGPTGSVTLTDINAAMLTVGRERLTSEPAENIRYVQADGSALPFPDDHFHAVTIAFGLRNFTDKAVGLAEMHRVLAPGGVLVVLEFSHIENPLLRDAYEAFKSTWPLVGKYVVGEAQPYEYLVESIERHPHQRELETMLVDAGFRHTAFENFFFGAAAMHRGVK